MRVAAINTQIFKTVPDDMVVGGVVEWWDGVRWRFLVYWEGKQAKEQLRELEK